MAVWAILASTAYLLVQVMRHPHPGFAHGSWSAFWKGTDLVIALPISWAPLAADYSRHSKSARAAFGGAFIGYGLATIAFFVLGLLATAVDPKGDVIASVLAIPVGSLALLILVLDELDEVFANIYSTVVSIQNIGPRLDRRVMAVVVGAVSTMLALRFHNWQYYENFLLLIGSVFVPLFATFIVDYYLFRRGRWDVSEHARPRWEMTVPWAVGFCRLPVDQPRICGVVGTLVGGASTRSALHAAYVGQCVTHLVRGRRRARARDRRGCCRSRAAVIRVVQASMRTLG